jgi:hypothetical protein
MSVGRVFISGLYLISKLHGTKTHGHSTDQVIPRLLWTSKFNFHVYNRYRYKVKIEHLDN